jgi:hypothetical protein
LTDVGLKICQMADYPDFERLTTIHGMMYQHQRAPLPLERLKDVPQPVVLLLEKLLEKDPAQRFQTPDELLKAMPAIAGAIAARRRIARQSLQKRPSAISRAGTRKPPAKLGPEKISIARLPVTGSDIFGREGDITFLDRAWAKKEVNVVTIVAWAGVRKSTLVNHWLRRMAAERYRSAQLVFGWSFYREGSSGETLRLRMNSSTLLLLGLEIQIHGSEQRGRKAKDWLS